MKTLILLLAAAMAAPALAQDSTTTTTRSTTTRTYETPSSSSSSSSNLNNSSSLSGSSTTRNQETTGSNTGIKTDTSSGSSSSLGGATTGTGYSSGSSTTAPSATAPSAAAPAASSPSAMQSSEETTSRSWSEDMGRNLKPGGFYIEPALLGTREDADIKGRLAGADTTGTSNGFGADLKLGGHIGEIVFLAADGRYERTRFADSAYGNQDSNVWNWGPTVGIQAPWAGMRVWGTYVVDGNYDPDSGANGTDLKFKDPYGWRGGVGFRISNVSLNLEYEDLTYRTTEIQSLGNVAVGTNTNVDFAQRGYALSLSFPIQL